MTGRIRANGEDIWVDQRGEGPDVLLVAGLTDPVESWELQLAGLSDRYRVTAYDNRGTGRTPLPDGDLTIPMMVEDAAAVMRALDIPSAHMLGFSGGSAIAQELALAYPHPQSAEAFKAQLAAFRRHSSLDRLHGIAAPTLVLGGEVDLICPPRHGRAVAGLIPDARFELMPGEAHQPFQEVPEVFNARVDEFWQHVEASMAALARLGLRDSAASPPPRRKESHG